VARRNACAAAVRDLLPNTPDSLLDLRESVHRCESGVSAVVGQDASGFRRDALRRLVGGWLLDPDRQGLFVPAPAPAPSHAARDLDAMTARHTLHAVRLAHAPELLIGVTVEVDGQVLASAVAPTVEQADRDALTHAMLRLQEPGADDAIPILACTEETWDAAPLLARVAPAGERLLIGRWTGEPALEAFVLSGWVGTCHDHD
jgi:hypothetical protein